MARRERLMKRLNIVSNREYIWIRVRRYYGGGEAGVKEVTCKHSGTLPILYF